MHWLDADGSRELDPVLDCLTYLAREADRPSSPVLLRAGLALADDGTLPFHQIEPALEQIGMRTEPVSRRLRRWPSSKTPAVLELADNRAAVLLETREADGLIYAPGLAEPQWVKLAELEPVYTGRAVVVETDPTREREGERPWDAAKRRHWFWAEVWKVRKEFWPVLLAALVVNLLAFAMPLFTMNVYDRVIPNKAVSTLWVLGFGVILALGFDFTLRVARARLIDEVGRKLDAKLSQKLFEKVMNLPMALREGSTGAFARRVSEFEMVRDFFASTTVVLVVDVTFLILFLALITVLAGWLVFVPIAGILLMLVAGLSLQKAMGRAALDAQADASLQHSVLVESIARRRDSQGGARRRPDARTLAPLFIDVRRDQRADAPADRDRRQSCQRLAAIDQHRASGRRLLSLSGRRDDDGRDHRHHHAFGPFASAGRPAGLPRHPRQAGVRDARFAAADDGGRRRAPGRDAQHRP